MRAYAPDYTMVSAKSLSEALTLMKKNPSLQFFAGGTDLMVLFEAGKLKHLEFLDINSVPELKKIQVSKKEIKIGALVTYSQIIRHKVIQKEFPMVVEAARLTGATAIQNRGTIGGNIANSSPAADTPPALMAYNAFYTLLSQGQKRVVLSSQFHKGYKKNELNQELLGFIHLERDNKKSHHFYRKVGTRRAQAISKICFASWARVEKRIITEVRIGMGSVGPTPLRVPKTEGVLRGQILDVRLIQKACQTLRDEIVPIDDIRSEAQYRLDVSVNLLEDFLNGLAKSPSKRKK